MAAQQRMARRCDISSSRDSRSGCARRHACASPPAIAAWCRFGDGADFEAVDFDGKVARRGYHLSASMGGPVGDFVCARSDADGLCWRCQLAHRLEKCRIVGGVDIEHPARSSGCSRVVDAEGNWLEF